MAALAKAPAHAGAWSTLRPALAPWLLEALATLDLPRMTPVQAASIPALLSHRDVVVEAVTGSGKTLAYLVPLLQLLAATPPRRGRLAALVVCPTRELAQQVHAVLQRLLDARPQSTALAAAAHAHEEEEKPLYPDTVPDEEKEAQPVLARSGALLVVGGKHRPEEDYRAFRDEGATIVVGTPGRVEELLKRKGVDARELQMLVLDEADRLLDLGFSASLQTILSLLPRQRRTGLFSATMSDALASLATMGLRNPARITVSVRAKQSDGATGERRAPASLQNLFAVSRAENRLALLLRILRRETMDAEGAGARKCIVYFATCAQVNYFYKALASLPHMHQLRLFSLHGKQTPSRRNATFESFVSCLPVGAAAAAAASDVGRSAGGGSKASRQQHAPEAAAVLLCTDVAARGLDLPDVDLVVQYDAPTDPKVFSHRAGRTARAGRSGRAVVLLNRGREEEFVDFMLVRKVPLAPYPYLLSTSPKALPEPGAEPAEDEQALLLASQLRAQNRRDRESHESSVRAFVSFLRAYSKHEAAYIFRLRDLDLGATARAFGLLRMPSMPEVAEARSRALGLIKGKGKAKDDEEKTMDSQRERELWGFEQEAVDLRTFAYLDPTREAQRLESLTAADEKARVAAEARAAAQAAGAAPEGKRKRMRGTAVAEEAWSQQKARKEMKEVRRDKRARKREFLKKEREEAAKPNEEQAKESEEDGEEDWTREEQEEKRNAKRLRKEKMERNSKPAEEVIEVAEPGFFDGL